MLYCMIRVRDDVPIRDADDAVQPFETEASVKRAQRRINATRRLRK